MIDDNSMIVSVELRNKLLQVLERSVLNINSIEKNDQIYLHDLTDLKKLIASIKMEAENLYSVFWSTEELAELKHAVDYLENRIQGMMRATLHNLNWYENEGWKQFNDKEADLND